MKHFAAALLLCLTVSVTTAKTAHAPLPEKLLSAKTMYIDNRSGYQVIGDQVYEELSKWGRYRVLNSSADADLVFVISITSEQTGSVTTGTATERAYSTDIDAKTTSTQVKLASVRIISPSAPSETFWQNTRPLVMFKSAVKAITKDYMRQVDEASKR